ncbi:MAG TPA: hypothetical protein EYP14_09335, partial [Planctomycetaceae bacterium]|nr:hypothetical protein [Planctomycetaceae bacterium]
RGDGRIACRDAVTGEVVWSAAVSGRAFTAALSLLERHALIGNGDGSFYCPTAGNGERCWPRDVGAPILQTAAGAAARTLAPAKSHLNSSHCRLSIARSLTGRFVRAGKPVMPVRF